MTEQRRSKISYMVPEEGSLRDQKTQKEITLLDLKIQREKGETWAAVDVRESWIRVLTAFRLDLMGTASQCAAATVGRSVAEIEASFKAGIGQVFARMVENPFGDALDTSLAVEEEPPKTKRRKKKADPVKETGE